VQARLLADETVRLPLPVETALYQIAQKALNDDDVIEFASLVGCLRSVLLDTFPPLRYHISHYV